MTSSRYQAAAPEEERQKLCSVIESLGQPPEGDQTGWEEFMKNTVALPLCYLDAVRKVVDLGRWKAKLDPVGFIRKTAQTAAFASSGLPEERRNRTKVHVGRAIDEDQKRPRNSDESLRFDQPKRRANVYAGNIADLKLPSFLEPDEDGKRCHSGGSLHDTAIDYFHCEYIDYRDEPRRLRNIAPDVVMSNLDDDDPEVIQKIDWDRVADKARLDPDERKVLWWKVAGHSRDSIIARKETLEQRKAVQAAWRRFDRKWPKIKETIKASPSARRPAPLPRAISNGSISAIEALQRLKENRVRDPHNKHRKGQSSGSWEPVYRECTY